MNPEKAVNHTSARSVHRGVHGEHGEETIDYMMFGIHPLDEAIKDRKQPLRVGLLVAHPCLPRFFVFSVPSVVIELRFLG